MPTLRSVCRPFRFVKGLDGAALRKAQLGLAHSYSRAKVKFNIHKVDNMIIQVRALPGSAGLSQGQRG